METQTIDLNRATADELFDAQVEGLDEKHASDLVDYREQYGPFESWEEVSDVPGFTQELADRMQMSGMVLGAPESDLADLGDAGLAGE